MPDSLSSDCQGLLRRLLHPDPAQRIKMEGVLRHPWFLTGAHKNRLVICLLLLIQYI
jgi:serine/threonine protein kinase